MQNTAQSGAASTNSFQYTGRENDGTGLYYYRARYYDPALQRFVSSDPIGFRGGINGYLYGNANPLIYVDPSGNVYTPSPYTLFASYNIPGALAALWTPSTSDATALTLTGGYAARVLGPFSPRGVPKPLARLREYVRFDSPHHGKGWEFDGKIPKWIRDKLPAIGADIGDGNDSGCK